MKKLMLTLAMTLALAGCIFKTDIEKGITAYENKEYATALKLFRPLADDGDPEAQYYLGNMYRNGEGVPTNKARAVVFYSLAIDQSNAEAQHNLGLMY
ncbi:MAG: sel1 repeat family protein [Alphaproteobacteria bacterium]|nr:sel1 repeat family protein [Alphaproteobacteria bacterium]